MSARLTPRGEIWETEADIRSNYCKEDVCQAFTRRAPQTVDARDRPAKSSLPGPPEMMCSI